MKKIIFILLIISAPVYLFPQSNDQCYNCHNSGVEDQPGKLYTHDLHFRLGISCADCHGGDRTKEDMDEAMSKKHGFIGVPAGEQITQVCLKCHASESRMERYHLTQKFSSKKIFLSSVHGKNNIATCITCHGVHDIRRIDNKYAPVYGKNQVLLCAKCHSDENYIRKYNPSLPTDQLANYKTSIHGIKIFAGDEKVAACADCHSAHDILSPKNPLSTVYPANIPKTCSRCHSDSVYMKEYGIPTDQYAKYSISVHGKALLVKKDLSAPACNDCHGNHGAYPVGISSISNVCGNCHALNAEMFSASKHFKAFKEKNIPQCEICHSNHLIVHPTDNMLGVGSGSKCIQCHTDLNDKGYQAAFFFRNTIDSLFAKNNKAEQLLDSAENLGMDVSDTRFRLKDVKPALIKARTVTHRANVEDFKKVIAPGFNIVNKAIESGNEAIEHYYIRRWGLGAATLIITILVISLYFKLRRIERKQKSNPVSGTAGHH